MRLNRLIIFVKDLDRMAAFYSDTVRLKAISETRLDSWVEFETGAVSFALHAIPPHLAAEIEITSPPRIREDNPVKVTFTVDDVASERRRLESLGVTVIERPVGRLRRGGSRG